MARAPSPTVAYANRGDRVDIGGRSIYLDCRGEGSPTIVLDAGMGSGANGWGTVFDGLAATSRTCAYDRPGRGSSDARGRHTLVDTATDLRAALQAAGEVAPFIVVGHSHGGDYARVFGGPIPRRSGGHRPARYVRRRPRGGLRPSAPRDAPTRVRATAGWPASARCRRRGSRLGSVRAPARRGGPGGPADRSLARRAVRATPGRADERGHRGCRHRRLRVVVAGWSATRPRRAPATWSRSTGPTRARRHPPAGRRRAVGEPGRAGSARWQARPAVQREAYFQDSEPV